MKCFFHVRRWSAKLGAAILGLMFNFVDANWNLRTFLLCLFVTEEMGKSVEEHEAIITATVRDNEKLGLDCLVFSGISDNEPSVGSRCRPLPQLQRRGSLLLPHDGAGRECRRA